MQLKYSLAACDYVLELVVTYSNAGTKRCLSDFCIMVLSLFILSSSTYMSLSVKEFKPRFYDLLLTDIDMPKMNGFQLCEKILELDVNIRVCFMSALELN